MSMSTTLGKQEAALEAAGKDKSEVWGEARTKQSFKDETDVNRLVHKLQRGESIAHLQKYGGVYGDFSDTDDLLTAHHRLQRGQKIFDELPGEVRREFGNNPLEFFKFVNDPGNAGRLEEVLPALARPGPSSMVLNDPKRLEDTPSSTEPAPSATEASEASP